MKLNAGQLREANEDEVRENTTHIKRNPLYLILENIYDTYNVGGIFRLADALAVERIYLCGSTETPPNARIQKSSIGTYKVVPWEYKETAGEAIEELRRDGWHASHDKSEIRNSKYEKTSPPTPLLRKERGDTTGGVGVGSKPAQKETYIKTLQPTNYPLPTIIAIEQDARSVDYRQISYTAPVALVLGNETFGVLKETLDLCDAVAEIPMWGVNKSLNVIVSGAIVGYHAIQE
jgi:tRNA G18 (ribose-2'-O)-methylase SpoU